MQLEHRLAHAEARELLVKRVVVGALLVAAAVFPVLASHTLGSPVPFDKDATAFSIAAGAIYTAAWLLFFIGVASYYWRYLPRLRRTREELQDETIHSLRQEIRELRERLDSQPQAQQTRPGGPAKHEP